MITEDYVSFETAKLLKEKGFNESCYTYYDGIDDSINRFDEGYHFNNTSYPWGVPYDFNKAKKYVVAPTLQMAMKWLREVHDIDVSIIPLRSHKEYLPRIEGDITSHDAIPCKKYEEAAEVAIQYCLEHLI